MNEKKFVFSSNTVKGLILSVLMMLKFGFGLEIPESEVLPILDNLDLIVNVGGSIASQLLILYGRVTAKKQLSLFS